MSDRPIQPVSGGPSGYIAVGQHETTAEAPCSKTPHVIPYSFFNYRYQSAPIDNKSADRLVVKVAKKESGDVIILTAPNTWYGKAVRVIFGDKKKVADALREDFTKKYPNFDQSYLDEFCSIAERKGLSASQIQKFYDAALLFKSSKRTTDEIASITSASSSEESPRGRSQSDPTPLRETKTSMTFREHAQSDHESENDSPLLSELKETAVKDLHAQGLPIVDEEPLENFYSHNLFPEENLEENHHDTSLTSPQEPPLMPINTIDTAQDSPDIAILNPAQKKRGKVADFLAAKKEQTLKEQLSEITANLRHVSPVPLDPEKAKILAGLKGSYRDYFEKLKELQIKIDQLQRGISAKREKQDADLENSTLHGKLIHVENADAVKAAEKEHSAALDEKKFLKEEQEKIVAQLEANGVLFDNRGNILEG